MFRRKDSDPARPADIKSEPPYARQSDGRSTSQPEMPRRQVDLPTAPTASSQRPERQQQPAQAPTSTMDMQGKRLIVGEGISLSGEITACDRLVVEGSVQVTLNETRAIEITESGRFTNGKAEVEEAEISGIYEGELTVRNRLLIRSTGEVKGDVRYGEIEIERGGRLTGSVSMLEISQGGSSYQTSSAYSPNGPRAAEAGGQQSATAQLSDSGQTQAAAATSTS